MGDGRDRRGGRVAVVTGASAGVGRAGATRLAREGFAVADTAETELGPIDLWVKGERTTRILR